MKRNHILKQLSLSEKATFTSGRDAWNLSGLSRLKIRSLRVSDGPHGVRKQESDTDNLDALAVPATCFPPSSSNGCSFNRALIRHMGETIADECIAQEVDILLGPGINIKRSPLCGRNFEYYSEDPYVSGELGSAFVQGVQSKGVGTCLKHFAVNNQETFRLSVDSVVDERALHEIYLSAFERVIRQAKPYSIMPSYNKVNGRYACENSYLLHDILRGEWKYQGLTISDWGAVSNRVEGMKATLDIEMPPSYGRNNRFIEKAVQQGELSETMLDDSITRLLDTIEKCDQVEKKKPFDADLHHEIAYEIAAESIVLLKNENQLLPLENRKGKIALIGELARTPRIQGGGSSHINPTRVDSIKEQMEAAFSNVHFAAGYLLRGEEDRDLRQEAVTLAKSSEFVVLCIGLTDWDENEGVDRKSLSLSFNQLQLIKEISIVSSRIIVVLHGGSVIDMPWLDQVQAVLHAHLLGQAGAKAVVDIIQGSINPSGKLTETYPYQLEDTPCFATFPGGNSSTHYVESIYVGYRYYDTAKKEVRFPFGFGLSYTSFSFNHLLVTPIDDHHYELSVIVKNTGNTKGKEVIQLYIRKEMTSLYRAYQELKGFEKVELEPGEEKEVTFFLTPDSFHYYNVATKRYEIEQGIYEIAIGSSSRDCPLTTQLLLPGTGAEAPDYRLSCPSYYAVNGLFNDREFVTILGHVPPLENEETRRYTYDSTLSAMKKTMVGKALYRMAVKETCKFKEGESILTRNAIMESLNYMPLRSLVVMGGGALPFELADQLLMLMNGYYVRGIRGLLQLRKRKER